MDLYSNNLALILLIVFLFIVLFLICVFKAMFKSVSTIAVTDNRKQLQLDILGLDELPINWRLKNQGKSENRHYYQQQTLKTVIEKAKPRHATI